MGFHFAAFALTPSAIPNNWNWYQYEFLACGEYVSNTWRPTSATLKVEIPGHPATSRLPKAIASSPYEWYRWEKDLRENPDIDYENGTDTELSFSFCNSDQDILILDALLWLGRDQHQ